MLQKSRRLRLRIYIVFKIVSAQESATLRHEIQLLKDKLVTFEGMQLNYNSIGTFKHCLTYMFNQITLLIRFSICLFAEIYPCKIRKASECSGQACSRKGVIGSIK